MKIEDDIRMKTDVVGNHIQTVFTMQVVEYPHVFQRVWYATFVLFDMSRYREEHNPPMPLRTKFTLRRNVGLICYHPHMRTYSIDGNPLINVKLQHFAYEISQRIRWSQQLC